LDSGEKKVSSDKKKCTGQEKIFFLQLYCCSFIFSPALIKDTSKGVNNEWQIGNNPV
jgi:hypothetical protein